MRANPVGRSIPQLLRFWLAVAAVLAVFLCLFPAQLSAQVSVLTQRNDIARSGVNSSETTLTTANVNTTQFGRLFSYTVDGYVYAQPLYMPNVSISGKGTHNVIFVVTEHDSVYALDADSNGGSNAMPLWQITLLDAAHGAAFGATTVPNADVSTTDIVPEIGITSTPVIDPSSNTIYVVGKTKESGTYVQRLHALDIATGAEKFGGPVALAASVAGTGNGSSGGVLNFDPLWENQRAGLLLLNGIVYMGFAAHGDNGPWHGWILGYNATTLQQTGAFCSTSNGTGSGTWMSGAGLAADVTDPTNHPFGRMFIATGNGTFDATTPYTNSMDYGDDVINLDLTNGVLTVKDSFTPFTQATLDETDGDLASGGVLLLPDQTTGPKRLLVIVGKAGTIYIVNRDSMGGFSASTDNVVQEVVGQIGGVWGIPTYFNGSIYFWGTNDNMKAFSFVSGVMSTGHTSSSNEFSNFPGPTPVVSANGTTNGIVWAIQSDSTPEILRAYDPSNVNNIIYSSDQNSGRDTPGNPIKFAVPTVANGKVYVPAQLQVSVYGLLNGEVPAATPSIAPASEAFANSVQVTITDSTSGASIFYTTDGSPPTNASTPYTAPFTLTATTTVNAIATAANFLPSAVATATYTLETPAGTPTFSPAPGTYSSAQQVTFSDSTNRPTFYYTTDGSTPTTSSTKYSGPITVSTTTTIKAIATANGFLTSAVATGTYTIETAAATPTFSPAPGTYATAQQVTLSDTTSGASIYYTTDGSTPTTSSTKYSSAITVSATTTIKAIAAATGFLNSAVASGTYTIETAAATPTFSPAPGTYAAAQQVTLSDTTSGASIYYTTDGSAPTTSSTKYSSAITVSVTTTIKAIAAASGFLNSAVASGTYTIETPAATPTFSPAPGTYATAQQVTLSDTTSGASIYYTTDGSAPTTSSTKYSSAITVSVTTTIKAIAAASGFLNSAVASGTYTIETAAATPTFSPAPGTYATTQQVTLSDTTSGASIYYTTDGSTPTTSSTKYSAAITVSVTTTIKAIAAASGFLNSAVASATYTIETAAATPTFSPAPGTYATAQQVTLSDTTSGTSIYYTTDGSTPTTSSTKYSAAITVSVTTTIKAIAAASGFVNSAVASGTYTIETAAATPTFSPAPGTYATTQQVTLSDTTSGASIYYTTDGSTPTTSSTKYSAAITVSVTTTIKAIAAASGFLNSAVASATYTIETAAATPTFSPAPGTYATAQQVTLSDTTSSTSIYYTTDGSTPTTSSTKYSAAITVSVTTTIKAIAAASGFVNSAVASGTYTIETAAATPTFSPAPGTYATTQQVTLSDTTSGASIYYTTDGSTPTTSSTKYSGAITVSATTTIKAIAAATGFLDSVVASGSYTITPAPPTIDYSSGFTAPNLVMNGAAKLSGTKLALTSAVIDQISATYFSTPVNIQSFTTDFTFQLAGGTTPSGEGFTFCIQNGTPTAMGLGGGGLGYGPGTTRGTKGIPKSVAVKFDLVSNEGEGTDSTGVYTDGASPTVPATSLASSGIDLHSGDTFVVHIVYNGTQLALTITDTVTQKKFTKNFNVNIPTTVGANTAYVGFTGATSWKTATQEILTWTYSSN